MDSIEKKKQYSNEYFRLKYLAIQHRRANNDEEALKTINLALEIEPDSTELLTDKADIFYKLKEYDQSLALFESLLSVDNGRYTYLHGYYKCLYRLKQQLTYDDLENLIYLKEEDSLQYFEKELLGEQRDNPEFKDKLLAYFPEFMIPDSLIDLTIKEAKQVIASVIEKPNKRKRMLCEVYYLKDLHKSLFSYLSKEIKKGPSKWINYELFIDYKWTLKKYDDALAMILTFVTRNPDQLLVVAERHLGILVECERYEDAKNVVHRAQQFLAYKEENDIPIHPLDQKRLTKLYWLIEDLE